MKEEEFNKQLFPENLWFSPGNEFEALLRVIKHGNSKKIFKPK
jgi:hypothetical protein